MVAGHAFSGCRSLTFNITERREVESQVPYMHIWPLANVRGGRSHTLLPTLLQGCTVHTITQLKDSTAIHLANLYVQLLTRINFETNGEECKHFRTLKDWIFFFFLLLVLIKKILQKNIAGKCLNLTLQSQIQPQLFPKAILSSNISQHYFPM